ncbi:MAG: putative PEP-binding protein [Cyanobacteria bacterium P01_F01_bin.143]
MTWLYWLDQIAPSEEFLVGENIFILSQLLQRGHPIVNGFVLESSLLTNFLSNLNDDQSLIGNLNSLSQVDIDNYQALQSVAQESRKAIMEAGFPQIWQEIILEAIAQLNCSAVIIRPSFVINPSQQKSSFGLLQSRRGSLRAPPLMRSQITGVNYDALVWGIKKVWSELFIAKSIVFWRKLQIEFSQVELNLLIQPLQNVQASGSIQLNKEHICIRSIWGLNSNCNYGILQPDIYIINRQESNLIEQQLGIKNIYYHLIKSPDDLARGEEYIVNDPIEESLQETAVLNDKQIKFLLQSVEKITSENPKIEYFEWYLPQEITEATTNDLFYFHQLDFIPTYSINHVGSLPKTILSKPLLTGIAASPGKVTGQVFVYRSETDGSQSRSLKNLDQITPDSILVTNNLASSDISLLKNLRGLITETGSLTSHSAILARELGIPTIVNGKNATTILHTGEFVMIDGDQGLVYSDKSISSKQMSHTSSLQDDFEENSGIFDYPIGTRLMVNLSQENMLESTASLPIDGIGLLRSDLMLLDLLKDRTLEQWLSDSSTSQIIAQLAGYIKKFAAKFAPRHIFYRSLDTPLSQLSSFELENRGTAAYLRDPSFFDLELSALARLIAEGFNNINLILPFVRNVEEFVFCRDRFVAQGLSSSNSCQLWIMAEVPSVIFLLPEYITAGVQGVVIGTGDLTRLLFGLDREQIDVSQYYNNPALKNAISQLILLSKKHHIPCSICLHGTDINTNLIDNLINWGMKIITVEPQAISGTYRAIARAEQRLLLKEINSKKSSMW